jgi:hypothetical protein
MSVSNAKLLQPKKIRNKNLENLEIKFFRDKMKVGQKTQKKLSGQQSL